MEKFKDGFISVINVITYAVLGLFLLFFFNSLKQDYGTNGIIRWAGALCVLLLMSLIIGFVLSQLFPDRRSKQFHLLFNMIEAVCILIITLAGFELTEKLFFQSPAVDDWQLITIGNLLSKSKEIFAAQPAVTTAMINNPGVYAGARLFSILFSIAGFTDMTVNYTFMVIHFLCAVFAYRISRMLSGRVTSIAVYALMMIVPSQIFGILVRNSDIFGAAFIVLQIYIFLISRRFARMEKPRYIIRIYLVFAAIICAVAMFFNPAAVILPIAEIFYVCLIQRNRRGINPEQKKDRLINSLIIGLVSFIPLMILLALKAGDLSKSFLDVLSGYFSVFMPNAYLPVNLSSVWSTEGGVIDKEAVEILIWNQATYGTMLGAAFICNIISWFLHEKEHFIIRMYFLSVVILTLFSGRTNSDHTSAYFAIAIMTGALFETIYSALRAKAFAKYQQKKEELEKNTQQDTGSNSAININEESTDSVITVSNVLGISKAEATEAENYVHDPAEFLENPLPLPPKNEKGKMDFDIKELKNNNFDI